jgi:hypothetical protein
MTAMNLFEYPDAISQTARDVTGFDVQALDGTIGNVETASYRHGTACVVVDTDFWIFGEKRLLPAGVIRGVNWDTHTVFLGMSKDEIRDAPEYDEDRYRRDLLNYVRDVASYYEPWAPGVEHLPHRRVLDSMPLQFHQHPNEPHQRSS